MQNYQQRTQTNTRYGGSNTGNVTSYGANTQVTKMTGNVTAQGSTNMQYQGSGDDKLQIVEEVPVFVTKEVEVPYDVIIERPVENRIENRYYVDKEVEVEVEKIIEVPVEIIREEKKVIKKEKKVEIEKVYEKHIDVIREVPVEVIKEVPIAVERIVNVPKDKTIVQPVRQEVFENFVYRDTPVYVDKVIEVPEEVEVPVYVDKEYETIKEVPVTVYQDVEVEVERVVERKKEFKTEKIIEVPVEKIVEKEYIIDRVVDVPYEVEKIIERRVPREVEKIVEKQIVQDRVVEIPVEKRVEKPYTVKRKVEKIIQKEVDVPMVKPTEVEVPIERVIEEPYEVLEEVEVPVEKVVERRIEVPVYKEVEVIEEIEIEVPFEKVIEKEVVVDKEVEVEVVVEKFVEVPIDRVVDKEVIVEKVVEKPVYNQRIIEVPIEKIVEKRVEVPKEVYIEVPKYVEVEKEIIVDKIVQVPRIVERKSVRNLKSSTKKKIVSSHQKSIFENYGKELNQLKIENIKLTLEIEAIENQITEYSEIYQNPDLLRQQNQELSIKIQELESTLSTVKSEEFQLKHQIETHKEINEVEVWTEHEIRKLEMEIERVTKQNATLLNIFNTIGIRDSFLPGRDSVYVTDGKPSLRAPNNAYTGDYEAEQITQSVYRPHVVNTQTTSDGRVETKTGYTTSHYAVHGKAVEFGNERSKSTRNENVTQSYVSGGQRESNRYTSSQQGGRVVTTTGGNYGTGSNSRGGSYRQNQTTTYQTSGNYGQGQTTTYQTSGNYGQGQTTQYKTTTTSRQYGGRSSNQQGTTSYQYGGRSSNQQGTTHTGLTTYGGNYTLGTQHGQNTGSNSNVKVTTSHYERREVSGTNQPGTFYESGHTKVNDGENTRTVNQYQNQGYLSNSNRGSQQRQVTYNQGGTNYRQY